MDETTEVFHENQVVIVIGYADRRHAAQQIFVSNREQGTGYSGRVIYGDAKKRTDQLLPALA